MKYIILCSLTLFVSLLLPRQALAKALYCSEIGAIKTTKAYPEVTEFCTQKVNGTNNGCHFKARLPSPLNAQEKESTTLAWVVTASIIHSFDDKGQPRFMPEGALIVHISRVCEVIRVMGHAIRRAPAHTKQKAEPADINKTCRKHSDCKGVCVAKLTKKQEHLLTKEYGQHSFPVNGTCQKTGPACMPHITESGMVDSIICEERF